MARNALATTARAVKATAGQWLVLFFLTFVLARPAISLAAAAPAPAPSPPPPPRRHNRAQLLGMQP